MKFALIEGVKELPTPKKSGLCPFCGSKVVSKCGNKNIWHWAHHSKRDCDTWWENETEWHRNWKNNFPVKWQEVIHWADDGEKHIADVKTDHGCAIEFQHSFILCEEILSRNNFYPNLIWVVDGLRRKRDQKQFFNSLNDGVTVIPNPLLVKVYIEDCNLVKEWENSSAPVFFDFGQNERIWWLLPIRENGWGYLVPFSRQNFIEFHLGKQDNSFMDFLRNCINEYSLLLKQRNQKRYSNPIPSNHRVRRYSPRRRSRRL